ncbi:hypothetical protein BDV96DRAFT_643250 [Lophiotrema nucula]|uniref:Uncharacterized protein n=1 Tax=Lophiotrema nucula TaxID=690887 RepID=A0A6A5ZKY1_9PLEO|nr:hypothetical protein BDV96DRAFT_643250 [Lophiotrema nucula]
MSHFGHSRHHGSPHHRSSRHHDPRRFDNREVMTVFVGYDLQEMSQIPVVQQTLIELPDLARCGDGAAIVGIQPAAFDLLQGYFLGDRDFQELTRVEPHNILQCIVEIWSFCQIFRYNRIQKDLLTTGRGIYHGTYGGRHKCAIERPLMAWKFVHDNFGNARMHITDFIVSWCATACRCDRQELSQFPPEDQQQLVDYLYKKQAGGRGFNSEGVRRDLAPQYVQLMPGGGNAQPAGPPMQQGPVMGPGQQWMQPTQGQWSQQQQPVQHPGFEMQQPHFPQQQQQIPGSFVNLAPEQGWGPQQQSHVRFQGGHGASGQYFQ